jgi:hypothetical protein
LKKGIEDRIKGVFNNMELGFKFFNFRHFRHFSSL